MDKETEGKRSEWKEIISIYFSKKLPVRVVFKYPKFDSPTLRGGLILRVGDYSFTLKDVKLGEEHFSYDHIIEVKELRA